MTSSISDAEFRTQLRESVELWNHHSWFECHDALEALWKRVKHERKREPAQDPRRDFVHGILLLAVAYYHWTRGNVVGVGRKLPEARKLLGPYPARVEGIELERFLRFAYADLERGGQGGPYQAERVPRLVIELASAPARDSKD